MQNYSRTYSLVHFLILNRNNDLRMNVLLHACTFEGIGRRDACKGRLRKTKEEERRGKKAYVRFDHQTSCGLSQSTNIFLNFRTSGQAIKGFG